MLTRMPVPDDFLREIGRVTVEWNRLETAIDVAIAMLLGQPWYDPKAAALLSTFNNSQRLKTLETLSAMHCDAAGNPEFHVTFKTQTMPRLNKALTERNRLTHSRWSIHDDDVIKSRVTAHGAFKVDSTVVTMAELDSLTKELIALSDVIFGLIVEDMVRQGVPTQGARAEVD